MMKRFLLVLLLVMLFLVGCAPGATSTAVPTAEARTLNVFAAASLTDAFTEIGKKFEAANPDVAINFNFAGSQALRTQIEEGAPADIFASANKAEMDALIADELVSQEASQDFLSNRLVVVLPANNPAALEELDDLSQPDIKIVLAAEEVPAGMYARQALDAMSARFGSDFKDKVLANVVSNEDNVRQVLAKVQLGEADAGIVYTSDAMAAPELKTLAIPAEMNVIANYPVARLNNASHSDLADAFIAFVLSPEGQTILQNWGFAPAR